MVTTVQLEEKIKHKLEEMKLYPRETYSRVIERLIKIGGAEEELSPQTIKDIEMAIQDIKRGRVFSTKEAKERLHIR